MDDYNKQPVTTVFLWFEPGLQENDNISRMIIFICGHIKAPLLYYEVNTAKLEVYCGP